MPAVGAVKVTVTVPVVPVVELWLKVAFCTLVQLELNTALPEAMLNSFWKFAVVIDWLITNVLLPAGAVSCTQ